MRDANSTPEPERTPRPRRGLGCVWFAGGTVLLGSVAAGWWTWQFINTQLAPLVAESLSKTLDRPVEVGDLQSIGLTHLTFGESRLPPTPTDPDRATLEQVQVRFNLLDLFWDRTLSLDVTLVRPDLYIVQDPDGVWIATEIQQSDEEDASPIKIELDTLEIQAGRAQLVPSGGVATSRPVEVDGAADEEEAGDGAEPDAPKTQEPERVASPVVELNQINGTVTFRNQNQLITYGVTATPQTGGNLRVEGRTDLVAERTTLQVNSRNLLAADISLLVPLPLQLRMGRIASDLEVAFLPENQPLQLNGTVRLQNVVGQLEGAPKPFEQVNGGLRFQGEKITFQDFRGRYGAIPAQVSGSLDTQDGYNLKVRVAEASLEDILKTAEVEQADLPIALEGVLRAEVNLTGPIDQPLVRGTVQNLEPVLVDRVQFARTVGSFTATPQAVIVQDFEALPQAGGRITADGTIKLGEQGGIVVDLRADQLPGDALARTYGANLTDIALGSIDATAQVFGRLDNVQTLVQWQAPEATYPGRGRLAIAGERIRFEDTALLIADGIVRGSGEINQGRWQAAVDTSGIRLNQFSPDLRGLLSGSFQLAGRLDNFDPAAIQAEGQVRLSEGLALIEAPLEASLRWLGDRLQIVEATATGFRGNGTVFTQLQGEGAPAISNLDLNVDLSGYRLTDLPVTLPPQAQIAGTTDFSGRVTGPLDGIQVAGTLGLNNFVVNTFAFEPRLAGEFRFALNQGLSLDLAGQQDRLFVELDERNLPNQFEIRQGGAIATGQRQGDILQTNLTNFELANLNLTTGQPGLGAVQGRVSGTVRVNLASLSDPALEGNVTIAYPALGYGPDNPYPELNYLQATQFKGDFRYANGKAVLEESVLQWDDSRYLLSGEFVPATNQFQATLLTADRCITAQELTLEQCNTLNPYSAYQGRIENLLALLRWYEFADLGQLPPIYGVAANVETLGVGQPGTSLLNQLRRYAEIQRLYRQQVLARESASPLPDLSTLEGPFTGQVEFSYSPQANFAIETNIYGRDWQWGTCSKYPPYDSFDPGAPQPPAVQSRCQKYEVDRAIATGSLRDQILTLNQVAFESDESSLRLQGTYRLNENELPPALAAAQTELSQETNQDTIQVEATNIPVAVLRDLSERAVGNFPVDVDGKLNANVVIGGTLDNPNAQGDIDFVEGRVNQTDAPPLSLLFGYNNARLDYFTRVNPAAEAAEAIAAAPESPQQQPDASPASPADSPADPTAAGQFQFTGSIPYQLPFAKVAPASDNFEIDLAISGDRLQLISLLTDQVEWKGGEQGEVSLKVRGNLPDGLNPRTITLETAGVANFANARVGVAALPAGEDLLIDQANILFGLEQIEVTSFTGRFGTGTLNAQGVLPLQTPLDPNDLSVNPLIISLQDLDFELANLFDGQVPTALIEINGTALAPAIGGDIVLSNGRIFIPTPEDPNSVVVTEAPPPNPFVIRYDSLKVSLGERLRVVYDPVANFLVQGDVFVSGTQADPLLDGTVRLRSGQVNVFTTQFNLAKGYPNTAQFRSERGLDPVLDVRLATSVPEVSRVPNQTNSAFPVSEVAAPPAAGDFGAIQTVRVQATATGPASQLFNNLELTSSPSRSETEILALLGGGFINNVQGDATAALATLAGSQFLTGLQNLVNDNLGITDFRLFPTTILSEDARNTSLALAAELGVDITANGDLSASVLQILTVPQAPLFSLRYRINDQFLLRGSTNFEGDNRAVLEFETRF